MVGRVDRCKAAALRAQTAVEGGRGTLFEVGDDAVGGGRGRVTAGQPLVERCIRFGGCAASGDRDVLPGGAWTDMA
ncbi:hypothetical protein NX02_17385 [Sphingomonas sanxanigenens DSM 19645 = NX02]|uniref:Uncharacterized protein n=1 Tax=Sphingomonas sanxanigenens DSM 19645 = NX02 TaxID=1123269 RepID=W0AB51_9SPHN|nr:hypothetical protein NX02_17385 [Sphingomonas sanxanigenens DSM 19645 = NX02]